MGKQCSPLPVLLLSWSLGAPARVLLRCGLLVSCRAHHSVAPEEQPGCWLGGTPAAPCILLHGDWRVCCQAAAPGPPNQPPLHSTGALLWCTLQKPCKVHHKSTLKKHLPEAQLQGTVIQAAWNPFPCLHWDQSPFWSLPLKTIFQCSHCETYMYV